MTRPDFRRAAIPTFIIAADGIIRWLRDPAHAGAPLVVSLCWAVAVAGFLLDRSSQDRRFVALDCLMGAVSPVFCGGLALVTGGIHSPAFIGLAALSVLQVAFSRLSIASAVSSAVVSLGVGAAIGISGQAPRLGAWLFLASVLNVAAIQAAAFYRRLEVAAARERASAATEREAERRSVREGQAQLLRQATAERLATMGRMAAAVAHELNNPLAYVLANVEFLRSELSTEGRGESPKEWIELLDQTHSGLEQIRQIAADLRGLSREETSEVTSVSLRHALETAVRVAQFRVGKHKTIRLDVPACLPEVLVAPSRLTQVLINLLANAGDAISSRPDGSVSVTAEERGDLVVVRVEDNGVGLPTGWQRTLFKPFFTTKPLGEGTGLGLSLSRHYVESFGGALWAEERAQGGARFCVALPVANDQKLALSVVTAGMIPQ